MIKCILFTLGSLFMSSSVEIPEKIWKKAEKEIEKFYGIPHFSAVQFTISSTDKSLIPADFSSGNLFRIIAEEVELGFGYIGNAPSKTATFDYLVLFDKDFIIVKTSVLVYREEYGGEIGSKRWLQQFNGGSSEGPSYKYIEDIIPISGATISAQSMTRAINELMRSIKNLKSSNQI